MATREFTDDKPKYWTLKGGRHNALDRHRGMHGLWYLVGTWGSGGYQSGWSVDVFPDSVSVSGYAGKSSSRIMTEALMSRALLRVSGQGGHDYGKSAMSKGGYRPGGPIQYLLNGKQFDPQLLNDGDELLRQVFGYEPTPEAVREGVARDQARRAWEEEEAKLAKEEQERQWREQYEARQAAETQAKADFETMFDGVAIPPEFQHRITHEGLRVSRDRGEGYSGWVRYYDQVTLASREAHAQWLSEAQAKLSHEQEEATRYAARRAQEESEQRAREAKIAAEKAVIVEGLGELDDLLANL